MAKKTQNKSLRSHFPSFGSKFLFFAILSLCLLVLDQRDNRLEFFRQSISTLIHPIYLIVDTPITLWNSIRKLTKNQNKLLRENKALQFNQQLSDIKLQRFATLEAENLRLREILEATTRISNKFSIARIMSIDTDPFKHSILINKGKKDGIFQGQTLIDYKGVVGQITQVNLFSSKGILITDPNHAIPIEINRNGIRTVALGTGGFNNLKLPFLPNNTDIDEGDLLVTSGLGRAFPPGYPVAIVEHIELDPLEQFATISAKPLAALNQNREVILIWNSLQENDEETLSKK